MEAPLEAGPTPSGERRIVYMTGGKFSGPRLQGRVLPGGGDWLVVGPQRNAILDDRACLEMDDGAIDPARYCFGITSVQETASEK